MGILTLATADAQDVTQLAGYANASRSSSYARTGTYSYSLSYVSAEYAWVRQTFPNANPIYVRWALFVDGNFETVYQTVFKAAEAGADHVILKLYAAGYQVLRGTTVLKSGSYSFNQRTWYCIEMYVYVHDTNGAWELRINGSSVDSQSGVGTRNGATGVISQVTFFNPVGGFTANYIDDIVVRDDTWPGQGGLYVLVPNGAGDNAGWTASAGQPYECVDELPPTFTDYIYTDGGVSGTKHDFNFSNLPINPSSIASVSVLAWARLAAAGSGTVRAYAISGSTTQNGDSKTLDTSGIWVPLHMLTDPNTGLAWTKSSVDALKAGIETQ
jgi:hypothetical protein